MATTRPTWLTIDLEAVVHNFQQAQEAVGPGVEVWPVVKADGYGLGALPIVEVLDKAGASGFCVALVEEAAPLRASGLQKPISLLSGVFEGQEKAVAQLDLRAFVFNKEQAERLSEAAPAGTLIPLWIKINTGMNRLGFDPEDVASFLAEMDLLTGVWPAGLVSHLACADDVEGDVTNRQLRIMEAVLSHPEVAARQFPVSMANSAGLLAHPDTHFAWVRPGIMLYGASPFYPAPSPVELNLKPVATWTSVIMQVHDLSEGTGVGYGHSFVTGEASRIATVAVGYADGFSRHQEGRIDVLLHGRRAPVVGRVSMDMISVDVTHIPEAAEGSLVTLMGRDGEEEIPVEEIAGRMNTIPYEVFCNLGRRVPRRYLPLDD